MNHPNDRRYANTHEWTIASEQDGIYIVGISDYAQQALGDVVHASLPVVGSQFTVGEACCVLESVKAASDVHAPVDGVIVAINEKLASTPELINDEPYTDGWLFHIQATKVVQLDALMSSAEYEGKLD
jgi:glycine cleavage system H protein